MLLNLLVTLILLCVVFGLAWWVLSMIIPRLPPPLQLVAQVIFGLIVLVVVVDLFFGSRTVLLRL